VAELRGLLRTRKQLVRERASHIQRLQKTLEDANIKLDSVISEITGKSGRAMLEALIAGETDPVRLATLADYRVKAAPATLIEALRGRVTPNPRLLLRLPLGQIDALRGAIAEIDAEVDKTLGPFRDAVTLLSTIDGVKALASEVIVSEIGIDMGRFPTDAHLLSWAGMCPRNDESAGKRRSNRLRKGAPWLKAVLVQCAWAAVRKKARYLSAQFHRLKARRGAKKAILAVAASILTAAYHMLKTGTPYRDLGPHHLEPASKAARANKLLKRLAALGYTIDIKPLAQPDPAVSF